MPVEIQVLLEQQNSPKNEAFDGISWQIIKLIKSLHKQGQNSTKGCEWNIIQH